jgi:Concanavalin A-like lectin/glucanases superfamily
MRHRPLTSALDLRHTAALSSPAVPVPLKFLSLLRLFIDASYTASMTFCKAAQFVASSSQYLQAAHAATLDFSTGTNANKFSFEIWRNTATTGSNRCYLAKDVFNTAGDHGWSLRTSGTVGHESQLEFWAWNSSANAYGAVVTADAPSNWSHCVVTVDLTAPAVNFYFDGVTVPATTSSLSGTLGPLPTGQTAPLLVGAWNFGSSGGLANFYDGALASVRIWRQTLPTVLIPALFNGGLPVPFARLRGSEKTYLVAAWDLTEVGGERLDSSASANHLTEQNGPLGQATLCARLMDRGPAGYLFLAPRFNYAPFWIEESPINGRPALQFCGQHWMHAYAPGFCGACLSGDIVTVIRPTDLSIANFDYSVITADKESYDGNFTYFFPMIYNGKLSLRIRRDEGTSINSDPRGTTTLTAGNTLVTNQRGFGAGDAASLAYRVNGTTNSIDTTYKNYSTNGGNIQNQWLGSMESVDSLVLGGLNYDSGSPVEGPYSIQDRFAGYIATAVIYGGTTTNGSLSDAENLAVENWARGLAGV